MDELLRNAGLEPGDWLFTTSPDVGDPNCICSRCGKAVVREAEFVIRVHPTNNRTVADGGWEARFCMRCWSKRQRGPMFPPYRFIAPGIPPGPRFWMHEVSGAMRSVVTAYVRNEPMTREQLALLVHYLGYWIEAPCWAGNGVEDLRNRVPWLHSQKQIHQWLGDASEVGIDPL